MTFVFVTKHKIHYTPIFEPKVIFVQLVAFTLTAFTVSNFVTSSVDVTLEREENHRGKVGRVQWMLQHVFCKERCRRESRMACCIVLVFHKLIGEGRRNLDLQFLIECLTIEDSVNVNDITNVENDNYHGFKFSIAHAGFILPS